MKFLVARMIQSVLILCMAFFAQPNAGSRTKLEKSSLRGNEGLPVQPRKALLTELEEALGSDHHRVTDEQQLRFEEELRATFKALPKNSRGAVEGPSARYALHRLFTQRYGWQIKGLETSGDAWDAASPVVAMGDRVPPKMKELFEERIGNYGLDLQELAVLAATMDNMFRSDVSERLRIVYDAYRRDQTEILSLNDAIDLAHAYMCSLIVGSRVQNLHTAEVFSNLKRFNEHFPRHGEVETLLMSTLQEVAGGMQEFNVELMTSWLETFGKQLGHFEDRECQVMKQKLVLLEERPGNGRVRLGDFYGGDDNFHFTESVDYLRRIGALDESYKDDPKVIIPNYLHGPSNCVTPSGYYEICCFDECEHLMDQIESHLEAPVASPWAIASFVSSLASASQPSNRTLSPKLLRLLEDVAEHHNGVVPIHGRLFSQWMHQAYPRECSHPHLAAQPNTYQLNYHESHQLNANFTERIKYMQIAMMQQRLGEPEHNTSAGDEVPISLWSMHEQLVDPKTLEGISRGGTPHLQRMMALVALGFAGVSFAKSLPEQIHGKIKEL
eukprot:TRINITY_DN33958_c0_g1_i1.p1 TRINITY_DN33958_c0_g1~~TRINITY_DN33958_c0_g1_i1.p1  ORF type:complete len:556 (-),score=115.02 TRINITY_DN33958_c0_g1_i1:117-1784(-)